MATPPPPCTTPPTNCPKVCSPTCKEGYTCVLNVIDSLCACPVTSCVKVDFDTGTGDSSSKKPSPTPTPTPSKSSVLGPVLGGVFGVIAVTLIAFFLVRRQRKRRRTNAEQSQERGGDDHLDDTLAKKWVCPSLLLLCLSHPYLISYYSCRYPTILEARSRRRNHFKFYGQGVRNRVRNQTIRPGS